MRKQWWKPSLWTESGSEESNVGLEGHPLYNMLPEVKNTKYELRRKSAVKPKINTKRFMSSFINRLTFKYKLADSFH